MKLKFVFVVVCLTVFGCSFHSNQYELVKRLFSNREGADNSILTQWELNWSGYQIIVYPINVENEVWFVGENELVVRFDGWQIINVENLFPSAIRIYLEKSTKKMSIVDNDRNIAVYTCSEWVNDETSVQTLNLLSQKCSDGKFEFTNIIGLDHEGAIKRIDFFVHPNYPNISLEAA